MSKHEETWNGIKITVSDNTAEIMEALRNAKQRGLWAIGETAVGHAQDVIIDAGRVDTGRMLNSVKHAKDEDSAYIGTTGVDYAIYNELGSRRMKGIHFLQKAATGHTEEYREILKDSLKNA